MDVTNPPEGDSAGGVRRFDPGSRPSAIGGLTRAHPFVRRVAFEWRRLAGGGRTLIACSGGADSTALLLALTLATKDVAVGHVVHDLRSRADALADRDAVRRLAERFGLEFVEAEAQVLAQSGNKEALARRERYAQLGALAHATGCVAVATAHHADDQFETLLMALLRGTGLEGLRGIAPRRRLGRLESAGPMLIRPMLGTTRAEAREACRLAGVEWHEDATNADATRLRSALRQRVMPVLAELRPEAPRRAAQAADLMRQASRLIDAQTEQVFGSTYEWARESLRREPPIVIGRGLIRAAARWLDGRSRDRMNSRVVRAAVRAVIDRSTEPRRFEWPGGINLTVTARAVSMSHEAES